MKIKILSVILAALIFSSVGHAQSKDEFGNYNLKELTDADAQRIFGDMYAPKMFKTLGEPRQIKESIINGNKITTILFNYGSICAPNRLSNVADLVWNGLGYGFEFGPLAAAEVVDDSSNIAHIVDDSFVRTFQGDYSPDGTLKWGWLPKPGFVDTTQNEIARLSIPDTDGDGKPDSWPDRWYSPGAGKYVWPAFLGDQATAPDEEVYYVVDDYTNAEYPYSPFPSDSTKKGLGLDMEVRVLQFNNPLAESIMFLVYQITNASEKNLDKIYFGMHGDPHVGGASDYADDYAGFVDPFGNSLQSSFEFSQRSRNMVYAWDDPPTGMNGQTTGYFGWKFLESPSNHVDLIDNDDDGIIDESPDNSAGHFIDGINYPLTEGIADVEKYTAIYGEPRPRWSGDEDGDWNLEFDDIGIDGIGPESENYPGPDLGEGDGKPSQIWFLDANGNGELDPGEITSEDRIAGYEWAGSEPNFGLRDVTESDQIGLTSFHAAQYTNSDPNVPRNDPLMWEWLSSDSIDRAQELLSSPGDNIFNFGTGPLSIEQGEKQRFSMCILFGSDLRELALNAESSSRILESDYRFTKPPEKPNVTAVSEKGKVTLYWDDFAENSFDPYLRTFDFQGYKIYRSRDYTFSDVKEITDGFGNSYIGKPLAQYDLDDSLSGFHPVAYPGRGVMFWLGDNTGLVHEFVDSSVVDGVRYFYAVTAYDGGSIKFDIPPAETQSVISRDPVTGELTYDVNTVSVVPGGISNGMIDAEAGNGGLPVRISGNSTGDVSVQILDNLQVKSDKLYEIKFDAEQRYNVLDSTGVSEEFTSRDTVFVPLAHQNIQEGSVNVYDSGNNIVDTLLYEINLETGKIKGTHSGDLPSGEVFKVEYRYYPVYQSSLLNNEDANPVFDGMRVFVRGDILDVDNVNSKFNDDADVNVIDTLIWKDKNNENYPGLHVKYRADWEIRWLDLDTLADGSWANIGDTIHINNFLQPVKCPFYLWDVSHNVQGKALINENNPATAGNGQWDWGEDIILRPSDVAIGPSDVRTSYQLDLHFPPDSIEAPKAPKKGDIYFVRTTKPFEEGDQYEFTTKGPEFDRGATSNILDKITVVPNPYVAYSVAEEPGRTSAKRGERVLQFRNLPQKCTIRIYTITGELVQTINKDDFSSIASWDLLSFEGQRIAYGVYIYHVDAPGVGEKIGRFAVIK